MPKINPQRLLDDLRTLRGFGAQGPGVVRPSLSTTDMDSRRWLLQRMQDAGVEARIDGVGNVLGRSRNPGPALLIGSHSDTQPRGGWLDGALGVVYALEVTRALAENAPTEHLAIDPVAWIDEEGTYLSCLGSRAYCGLIGSNEIAVATNDQGKSLQDALAEAGLDGVPAKPEPNRYRGYLEAHIEQGAYLENDGKQVGVVTSIVGSRNLVLTFTGQQNHAGTTPMPIRKDAGMALIHLAHDIDAVFREIAGPRTVWTIGRVKFSPGASSIIPGSAEMHLQFRDPERERLAAFAEKTQELVDKANGDGPVAVTVEPAGPPIDPTDMDQAMRQHIAQAAEAHAPEHWQQMPSAAIHDAMFLAEVMPAAMLFVPSIGGISHDFAEDTADPDIVRGCQVLATAAAAILSS